jgi:hypothetical protein
MGPDLAPAMIRSEKTTPTNDERFENVWLFFKQSSSHQLSRSTVTAP